MEKVIILATAIIAAFAAGYAFKGRRYAISILCLGYAALLVWDVFLYAPWGDAFLAFCLLFTWGVVLLVLGILGLYRFILQCRSRYKNVRHFYKIKKILKYL